MQSSSINRCECILSHGIKNSVNSFLFIFFLLIVRCLMKMCLGKYYKMNDAKTPKKAEIVPKKTDITKTEVTKAETNKTEISETKTADTEAKSLDNSASKAALPPKSASQSSTSHFSSVSTPQYRSGWNDIFGGGGDFEKQAPDEVSKSDFPKKLSILDYDIDLVLRNALDTAFSDVAEKRGVSIKNVKESVRFEYHLSCEIKEKI